MEVNKVELDRNTSNFTSLTQAIILDVVHE